MRLDSGGGGVKGDVLEDCRLPCALVLVGGGSTVCRRWRGVWESCVWTGLSAAIRTRPAPNASWCWLGLPCMASAFPLSKAEVGFQHGTNPGGGVPACNSCFGANKGAEKCSLGPCMAPECCSSDSGFFPPLLPYPGVPGSARFSPIS